LGAGGNPARGNKIMNNMTQLTMTMVRELLLKCSTDISPENYKLHREISDVVDHIDNNFVVVYYP